MIWLLTLALLIVSSVALYELSRLQRDHRQLLEKQISIIRLCHQKDQQLSTLKNSYRVLNALLKEREGEYAKVLSRGPHVDGVFLLRAKYALEAIEIQGELGSAWDALAEVEACLKGDRDMELGIKL